MKSAPAIVFDHRPSHWIALSIGVIVAFGLVALVLCAMPWWAKIMVAVIACLYAGYCLHRFLRNPVQRVAWYAAGHSRVTDNNGVEHQADLQQGIVRGSWMVLRLRGNDRRRLAIILGPDNSDAELRRQLRVRLMRGTAEAV